MRRHKYVLTDEHRAQLAPWRDRWITNAMSTAAMTDEDREICREAARNLYRAADLTPPPPHRIVFVPSPFVVHFASGFAAWIWQCRRTTATRAATFDATYAATRAATLDATDAATLDATYAATRAATRAATFDATDAATRAATFDATRAATLDATLDALRNWYVVGDMIECARAIGVGSDGLHCATKMWQHYQGGNFWSAYDSYISLFRHIAKLPIDYAKWEPWEALSLHSSWRIPHTEFCIISDRPAALHVDSRNRPHCETGPFCRWRDGSALYAVHGIRVPAWIIEEPTRISITSIEAEENTEVRRVMIERFGWDRYVAESGAEEIHRDAYGALYGRDNRALCVRVTNGTAEPDGSFREYVLPVSERLEPLPDPEGGELGEPQKLTALNAVASTYGMRGEQYKRAVRVRT